MGKIILAILISFNAFGGLNKTFYYNNPVISLKGKIEIQTFPGPPNYESIKNGDSIERCWFLKLEEPINVFSTSRIERDREDPEFNVKIVQIAIEHDSLWRKIKNGEKVEVKGTLYQRQNGHHHSRVLINVNSLEGMRNE